LIPGTLLGLLAFAASMGPGFVYFRVAERYELVPQRSPLEEATRLIVVGSLASLVAALAVLAAAEALDAVDTSALADDPGRYVVTEPIRSLGSLLAIFVLSYGGAALSAWLIHRRKAPSIRPGDAAWHGAFWRDRLGRGEDEGKPQAVWLTVELQDDGRLISGPLRSYTFGTDQPRELTLSKPIILNDPKAGRREIPYDFLILEADRIRYVTGSYTPGEPPEAR
jgi:hypothetical protein